MKNIVFVVFLFCFPMITHSQIVKEIVNNNCFLLDNEKVIRIDNVYIPNDNDSIFSENLLSEIKQFISKYFLNRQFEIQYGNQLSDNSFPVKMFRTYISGKDDCAKILIERGYAINLNKYDEVYTEAENKAIKNQSGIWYYFDKETIKNKLMIKDSAINSQVISNNGKISDDPCNDRLLNKLAQKENLTIDEMKLYVELRKLCEESKKTVREQRRNDKLSDSVSTLSSSISAYLTVCAIIGVVVLGIIVL